MILQRWYFLFEDHKKSIWYFENTYVINNKTFYDHTLKTLLINNFLKSSFENFRAVDKRAKVLDLTLFSFTDTGSFTMCAACAKGAYKASETCHWRRNERLQIKTIMNIGSRVSYAKWHRIFTYMIVFQSKIWSIYHIIMIMQ